MFEKRLGSIRYRVVNIIAVKGKCWYNQHSTYEGAVVTWWSVLKILTIRNRHLFYIQVLISIWPSQWHHILVFSEVWHVIVDRTNLTAVLNIFVLRLIKNETLKVLPIATFIYVSNFKERDRWMSRS